MKTVSFQGSQLSAGQRRRLQVERSIAPISYSEVDWDALRAQVNSRMFIGPPAPPKPMPDFEAARYWRMAQELSRYGYCEFKQHGTPFVGDAFGHGQPTEVNL